MSIIRLCPQITGYWLHCILILASCCYFHRNTALHFAAWHNRSDIVELLLANGAMVTCVNTVSYILTFIARLLFRLAILCH